MSTLKIRLFGNLEVSRLKVTLSQFPTRKARGLFAYLALHIGKLHHRERLAGLFWPQSSEAAARKRLRTELWHTRKFLTAVQSGQQILVADNERLGIDPVADVWVDRNEFEEELSSVERAVGLTSPDAQRLARAVELYRGPLLEGSYEDWCVEEREYLEGRWIAALEQLMAFHQHRQQWREAIRYGDEVLRQDPLAEHVHRAVMSSHFELRNRTAALRQYKRCVAVLARELDVAPMPETTELCHRIRACRV